MNEENLKQEREKARADLQKRLKALKEKHDKEMEEIHRVYHDAASEQQVHGTGCGEAPWSETYTDDNKAPPSGKVSIKWYEFAWVIVKALLSAIFHQDEQKFPPIPETVRCGSFDVDLTQSVELFRSYELYYGSYKKFKLYVRTRLGHYVRVVFFEDGKRDVWKISKWDAKADYVKAKDAGCLLSDNWHPRTEI